MKRFEIIIRNFYHRKIYLRIYQFHFLQVSSQLASIGIKGERNFFFESSDDLDIGTFKFWTVRKLVWKILPSFLFWKFTLLSFFPLEKPSNFVVKFFCLFWKVGPELEYFFLIFSKPLSAEILRDWHSNRRIGPTRQIATPNHSSDLFFRRCTYTIRATQLRRIRILRSRSPSNWRIHSMKNSINSKWNFARTRFSFSLTHAHSLSLSFSRSNIRSNRRDLNMYE